MLTKKKMLVYSSMASTLKKTPCSMQSMRMLRKLSVGKYF